MDNWLVILVVALLSINSMIFYVALKLNKIAEDAEREQRKARRRMNR